jgi:single-strand DNA-binding protein
MAIHVTLHGRLGRDPELKTVGTETVCKLNVAADHGWGEKKTTTWVSVDVWGRRGQSLAGMLKKGSEVVIRGEMYTREYEKDGQKRISLECRADAVDFAGSKRDDSAGSSSGYSGGSGRPSGGNTDDIPF